jgi:hypothetical protein
METEDLLLCSQHPATGPYPEPAYSLAPSLSSILILSSHLHLELNIFLLFSPSLMAYYLFQSINLLGHGDLISEIKV